MAYQPDEVNRPAGITDGRDPAMTPPPPPPYPEGTSSERIARDIRRTRAEMDETVDALEERLHPRHLIDDFLDLFRSSGGGSAATGAKETFKDAGYKIVDKLKQHPMPAALIGAGIVWMLFEGEDDGRTARDYRARKWDVPEYSGSYVDARTGQPYRESYGQRATSDQPETFGGTSMTEKAKDKLSGAAESVKDTARSAGEKVSEWAGSAREGASSAGHAMRDFASSRSEQFARGYESGKHYLERGMDEYPLAMGAAAMALGVISGLLLPRTRTEDRWMGEASDEVKQRAREAGQEVIERGKDVARVAGDEAQRQGLSTGTVAEKVKRVAQDVKEAASESARREGIDPQSLAHKGKEVAERTKESAKESARDQAQREKERFDA